MAGATQDTIQQEFQGKLGRQATQQEVDFLLNVYGQQRAGEATQNHINSLLQARNEAKNLATAYGLTLDDATAQQYVDSIVKPGDYNSFNNFRSYIEPVLGRKAAEQQQQQLTNPTVASDKAAGFQQSVSGLIQEIFGRAARPDEMEFFSNELAKGVSPYELRDALSQTPEYQQKQADAQQAKFQQESTAARGALDQELQASNLRMIEKASPQIIGQFMKAGRLGSSGVVNALARAQADLDKERQVFLANAAYTDAQRGQGYQREDFVARQNQAYNQYLRQSEPGYQSSLLNAQAPYQAQQRQYGLIDQGRQRQYEIDDYNRQQSDYNRYLSDSRRSSRESALYGLGGSLLGAGLQGLTYGYAKRGY